MNLINSYLLDDEHIVWAGQPSSHKLLDKSDVFNILFFVGWTAIISFIYTIMFVFPKLGFTVTRTVNNAWLYILPFAIWGVTAIPYTIISTILTKKRKTYYYVTNKRVIVFVKKIKPAIEYVKIKHISYINYDANKKGIGNIYSDTSLTKCADRNSLKYNACFLNIDNVEKVFCIILEHDKEKQLQYTSQEAVESKVFAKDEYMLWKGSEYYSMLNPKNNQALIPGIIFCIVFIFFIFIISMFASKDDILVIIIFFIPFIIVGVLLFIILPYLKRKRKILSRYYITTKRIGVFTKGNRFITVSYLEDLKEIELKNNEDSTGSIYFNKIYSPEMSFYNIWNAKEIHSKILYILYQNKIY